MACGVGKPFFNSKKEVSPYSHNDWTDLLQKHVSSSGAVNYKGFIADSISLNTYLSQLSNQPPTSNWTEQEQLAYWINAYNAFTVQLIVRNYPVQSIKELGGGIYKVNTPWDIKFIQIGDQQLDLNNIEHGIIRKHFNEPRIHFAVNCASVSCPRLRNEAYEASKLDAQLKDQLVTFLEDTDKNFIEDPDHVKISKIFSWFKGDFKKEYDSVIEFINQEAGKEINANAEIDYNEYKWDLNE